MEEEDEERYVVEEERLDEDDLRLLLLYCPSGKQKIIIIIIVIVIVIVHIIEMSEEQINNHITFKQDVTFNYHFQESAMSILPSIISGPYTKILLHQSCKSK